MNRLRKLLFPRGRPKHTQIPDFTDPCFRRWVVDLKEPQIHKEVLLRIRERRSLILNALILAGPDLHSYPYEVVFPSLSRFLERVTITAPRAEVPEPQAKSGSYIFHLLPGPAMHAPVFLLQSSRAPQPEVLPDVVDGTRSAFETHFLKWLWDWPAVRRGSLEEYEALLRSLRHQRKPGETFRESYNRLLIESLRIKISNREYPLPRAFSGPQLVEPAEIARRVVAAEWEIDPQAVKVWLARWRKERPINAAWARYTRWLRAHPTKWREIERAICGDPLLVRWPKPWRLKKRTPPKRRSSSR